MTINLTEYVPSSVPAEKFFVEVVGPDGLMHHVGPFHSRDDAQDWITQNTPDQRPEQEQIDQESSAANKTKPLAIPTA